MAVHKFACDTCGTEVTDDNADGVHICPNCGSDMYWDCGDIGIREGDYSHTSASLAINPCQTAAHRKLFPGIDVLPDGQLHFDSVKKQSDYCKKTGFEKMPQKIKKKGTKIA